MQNDNPLHYSTEKDCVSVPTFSIRPVLALTIASDTLLLCIKHLLAAMICEFPTSPSNIYILHLFRGDLKAMGHIQHI